MTPTTDIDDSALTTDFARWLTRRLGASDLTVSGLRRPSAGYSSETIIVDASWSTTGARHATSLVVRMAPAGAGVFPHYDLESQWQAQTAAAAVGVPVADPVVETDTRWIGAPFMVMPKIDGHIIGPLAHRDDWLSAHNADQRGRIYRNLVATVCAVHAADIAAAPSVPRRANGDELAFWNDYLMWSSDGSPVPTLVEALAWCRRHQPDSEPPSALLWGDVRFENVVFGDNLGPRAVLDWDMTSIGAPEHDVAWFTSLDLTTQHVFGERLPGFPDRTGTIALFEEFGGRAVQDLEWYETLAMVRSTAVMTRISYLRRAAGEPLLLPIDDNLLLDLLRARLT